MSKQWTYQDVYDWMKSQGDAFQIGANDLHRTDPDRANGMIDDFADEMGIDNEELTSFLAGIGADGALARVCAGDTPGEQFAADLVRVIDPESYVKMVIMLVRAWKYGVVMGTKYTRENIAHLRRSILGDS